MKLQSDAVLNKLYLEEFKIRFGFPKNTDLEVFDNNGIYELELSEIELVTFNKHFPNTLKAKYLGHDMMSHGTYPTFRAMMDILKNSYSMVSADIAFSIVNHGLAGTWGDLGSFKIFFLGTFVKDMFGDDYIFCIRTHESGFKISYAWDEDSLANSLIAVTKLKHPK